MSLGLDEFREEDGVWYFRQCDQGHQFDWKGSVGRDARQRVSGEKKDDATEKQAQTRAVRCRRRRERICQQHD